MNAMRVTLLGCLIALAACGDSAGGDQPNNVVDAGASNDASHSSDAPAQPGLSVAWVDMPAIPGPFATGIQVTSFKVRLARIEAVGDGGGTVEDTNLSVFWTGVDPFEIFFFGAPPALYSTLSLTLRGDMVFPSSYEILGTRDIGSGTMEPFRISDTDPLSVDVTDYTVQLMPGRSETMWIKVDLQDVFDAINFMALPLTNNVRTLDQTNTVAITPVRNALRTSVFLKTP